MYQKKFDKDLYCPLEYGIDLFGHKWHSRIICVLNAKKVLRYGELKQEIFNITDTILTLSLNELIKNDIVKREQFSTIPPKVEYSLTEKGNSIIPILQSICRWAGAYHTSSTNKKLFQCQKCNYYK